MTKAAEPAPAATDSEPELDQERPEVDQETPELDEEQTAPEPDPEPEPLETAGGVTPMTPEHAARLERLLFEIKRVIVGQDRAIERMIVTLLAGGHCLLEGVPGLAKTLAAETLAKVVGGSFVRLQFTPDLLPSDIVGTRIYRGSTETFDVELGPIFANVVLADEINRAPAKVQSALLEVMAESHVSIGGTTYDVPQPFFVLATQNPIESEGVYPLPEAQRDRFLMKVLIPYPSAAEELEIVRRMGTVPPTASAMLSADEVADLQAAARGIYVDRDVLDYAVRLVLATRDPAGHGLPDLVGMIAVGASPRASLGLIAAGRALALLRGRSYVLPQDVFDVGFEILNHRIVLSYEALADGVSAEQLVVRVLSTVPAPRVSPANDDRHLTGVPRDRVPGFEAPRPPAQVPANGAPAPAAPGSDIPYFRL